MVVRLIFAGFLGCAGFWTYMGVQELASQGADATPGFPPGCTSLALDRSNGRTIAEPCSSRVPSPTTTLTADLGQPSKP